MPVKTLETVSGCVRVELPEALTIAEVAEEFDGLSKALEGAQTLDIDAEATMQVDTAGLQLICALVQEARRCSVAVTWSPGSTLSEAADTTGLASAMGLGD